MYKPRLLINPIFKNISNTAQIKLLADATMIWLILEYFETFNNYQQ